MNPVEPHIPEGALRIVFGEGQPEYMALPAAVIEEFSQVVTEWELTAEELYDLNTKGRIRLTIMFVDFTRPFTPLKIEVVK